MNVGSIPFLRRADKKKILQFTHYLLCSYSLFKKQLPQIIKVNTPKIAYLVSRYVFIQIYILE